MSRPTPLSLDQALAALKALRELHRVCLAMDADSGFDQPSDDEYQAAMTAAEAALSNASGVRQ